MGVQRLSTSGALTDDSVSYSSVKADSIIPATVTGGTQFILDDFVYRKFTASDTLTVSDAPLTCDLLIVAGGGGGGDSANTGNLAGGGGGGGLITLYNQVISPGSLSVTVGAGGARAELYSYARGSSGGDSSVAGFTTAIGGGGGGGASNRTGGAGGSGGGAAGLGNGGAGTAGQGFKGADMPSLDFRAGGGGGAGEPGGIKTSSYFDLNNTWGFTSWAENAGYGKMLDEFGVGSQSGVLFGGNRWYASGGGGGWTSQLAVQLRIATPGSSNWPGFGNAPANSGGGGCGNQQSANNGSSGGSGIVVMKYRRELVGL